MNRHIFTKKGIDTDDDKIDDEVNDAAEEFAKQHGIEHYLITDFFDVDHGVRITLEDVGE